MTHNDAVNDNDVESKKKGVSTNETGSTGNSVVTECGSGQVNPN